MIRESINKEISKPTCKDVVQLLCPYEDEATKAVQLKNNKQSEELFWVHKCLKKESRKNPHNKIWAHKNHGHTNAFNHLASCMCDGDKERACKTHEDNLSLKQTSMQGFFDPLLPVSPKE